MHFPYLGETVIELDETYTRYFAQTKMEIVIARPDFYVFGGVPTFNRLPALVEELRTYITDPKQLTKV